MENAMEKKINYPLQIDPKTYALLKQVAKLKDQSIKDCLETAIALLLKDNWTLIHNSNDNDNKQ
jgi:hypothetical protein